MPSKAIGRIAPGILNGVFQKRGFAQGQILAQWPGIAGEELARFTSPEKISWPRRGHGGAQQDGATLVLRVEGPLAIEVQHSAPQLIERINSFFGYQAICKISIRQGPLPRRHIVQRRKTRALSGSEEQKLNAGLHGIRDAGLRKALERLGRGVIASS